MGILLAMLVFFAAYFAYDGLRRYPAKNLELARQNINNVPAEQKASIRTNPRVTMSELDRIDPGMTREQVRTILGAPAATVEQGGVESEWYVGPAAWAEIRYLGGKVRKVVPTESTNKSESDIRLQKILAAGLGIASLVMAVYYVRINTMRTVLDDSGLRSKGRRVSWEQITELDTSDYDRKGWLDVIYRDNGDTDTLRLDSYHIKQFDEIVTTICERKGFACPIRPKQARTAETEEV